MVKFFEKYYKLIVLILLFLLVGVNGITTVFKVMIENNPLSKEIVHTIVVEAMKEELESLKSDISEIKDQNKIFADNMAEDWVKFINKQYLKLQTNRDDLSWSDVAYSIAKWDLLPENWKTPDLTAKIVYLNKKYDEHISGD